MDQQHEILTVEEVASYLRLSERTVYDWAQRGEIPCGKLGTTWRFKRADIERWINDRLSSKTVPAPRYGMGLGDIFTEKQVLFLETVSKHTALRQMIDVLAETAEVADKNELTEEIFRREDLMSTGIGFGIAIPHVRLETVADIVMAVGISRDPITDYESLDADPVRIICMLAAAKDQHAQYLKTLAAISNRLKEPALRSALLNAENKHTVYTLLTR